jgi:hypothetical protein
MSLPASLRWAAFLVVGWSLAAWPSPASAQLLGAIGGIEGVGDESAATPLLTMTGQADFSEGAGAVAVRLVYARVTRWFGEKIENPSEEFGTPTFDSTRGLEITHRIFLLGYGVTDRWNIGLSLPFTEVRSRLPDPLSPTGPAEEQEQNGIGNLAAMVKYQFLEDPNLSVRIGAFLPSGYEVGAGFLQVTTDVAYSVQLNDLSLHAQTGFVWTDRDRQNNDPSDAVLANLALARMIRGHLVAVLELNYQQRVGRDDLFVDAPTQTALDLTPGFKIPITERLTFSSSVRIALINTLSLGYDTQYLFLLGYGF